MSVLFKDKLTGLWRRAASNLIYAAFPVGSIVAYGGSSDTAAPAGCMYCHGQVLNASDYPELYDVIGTKFGVGDGSTGSFSLPDLQGQFLRGAGTNRDSTQGNGGTVGTRQKATEIPNFVWQRDNPGAHLACAVPATPSIGNGIVNSDAVKAGGLWANVRVETPTGNVILSQMVRPTNTSVEYIIKVVK